MRVHFKTHSGDTHTLDLAQNATIGDARVQILSSNILSVKNPIFKLLYDGEILPDDRFISDLNLQEASSIIIQLEPGEKVVIQNTENDEENSEEEDYDEEIVVEPDNFDSLVNELIELGYEKDVCVAALRITAYQFEEAANLLVTENNQDVAFIENERRRIELEKKRKEKKEKRKLKKQKIIDSGNDSLILIQESSDDDDTDSYNDEEEEVITKRSILGPFREVYEKYSKEEKNTVDNLAKKLGLSTKAVIEVFEACERNSASAEAVLSEKK